MKYSLLTFILLIFASCSTIKSALNVDAPDSREWEYYRKRYTYYEGREMMEVNQFCRRRLHYKTYEMEHQCFERACDTARLNCDEKGDRSLYEHFLKKEDSVLDETIR